MGRLIDADNLRAQIEAHEIQTRFTLTDYEYGHNTGLDKAEDEVDLAETVDAIPVEWIEAKMQWLREHNGAFYDPAYFLETMLQEWKKEQEAPHCNADYCEIGGE